ncbi:shikimate dehydrogenase [Stackebrandtia albiflava]
MLGRPIRHSLSPVIHRAGYLAAGLTDWEYTAIECGEAEFPELLAGFGPQWRGLSITMPLKETALAHAADATPTAVALGAANTLIRRGDGWYADNTDAPGMVDVLRRAGARPGGRFAVLGAGGTARAALGAAADLVAAEVTVYARRPEAVADLATIGDRLGVRVRPAAWDAAEACGDADVVVSTVPAGVADGLRPRFRDSTIVFDVLYDPWPTPLAAAAMAAGRPVVTGRDLLLAQAVRQFVLFTGVAAPEAHMRAALQDL